MPSSELLSALRARLLARTGKRPDSEFEQAAVRAVIGALMLGYYSVTGLQSEHAFQIPTDSAHVLLYGVATLLYAGAVGLLLDVYFCPSPSPLRRMAGILLDTSAITYFMLSTDAGTVPIYALYLWVIFGNGFRYGQAYLYFALALSLVGFGAAVAVLPQWESNRHLGLGLWGGMLAVSVYVGHLAKRLTTALSRAEAANRAKRRFVSAISHELRTPLNAIIGTADLLRTTSLDSEQHEMLFTLQESSRLMLALIQDVLDFSKIEAGKQTLENIEFDLRELVQRTVDVLRYQAMAKGLRVSIDYGPGVPTWVRSDQRHLRQVLVNLLSNAVKFTESGWVSCRVSRAGREDGRVVLRFEVADSGIGIPEHRQSCIFDSFTQADESTTRRYGGTGLGTTIAKQLVELMGGEIGLTSEVGKGSTFWFVLPVQELEGHGSIPSRAGSFTAQTGPLLIPRAARPLNVLIAEDNLTNSRVIQQILERAGHRYSLATDGEQALDMMLAGRFDVVLLDMNMPEMSGLEVAKAYRFALIQQERAPLILFSADASTETRQECEQAGIDAYLPKPVQARPLLALLDSLTVEKWAGGGEVGNSRTSANAVPDVDLAVLEDLRSLGTDAAFLPRLLEGYIEDNQALVARLRKALSDRRLSDCRDILHAMKGSAVSIGAARMRAFCQSVEDMAPEELFASRESVLRECHLVFSSLCRELESRVIHSQHSGIQ
jgi:two-component system, sensor histidine kinase RpfC